MVAVPAGTRSLTLTFMVMMMLSGLTATSVALFPTTEWGQLPQGNRLAASLLQAWAAVIRY